MKKKDNLFWGLIFIAAALLLLVGQLNVFDDINVAKIFIGILFILFSIGGLLHHNFYAFLFFLAFFCILFDDVLCITAITPFPILGAAFLGAIGLSMLFPKKTFISKDEKSVHFDKIINETDESDVQCHVQFGSVVKYVNTTSLAAADLSCSFGAMKIYFDAAKIKAGYATINLDVSFGGVEIFIPKTWEIRQTTNAILGGVDIKGHSDSVTDSVITIAGNVHLGGVTIQYV